MSESTRTARIVEAEIGPLDWSKVRFPKVDMEPVRQLTEQTLLTGIGIGVLAARGLRQAVGAAYKAGSEEAEHTGSLAEMLVSWVRKPKAAEAESKTIIRKVPVMPIADYSGLSEAEVIDRLANLDAAQLDIVRTYEISHLNRPAVLTAIDNQLTGA
ncbi:MAG: hypothetical protein LLG44_14500 [Chloroflexi bacterium]|nr:hypothetical protein [Chloroflexota bacterium]